ncbi:hypothetical protein IVA80_15185 [Bradyrhizobium sp. 139]|uniref:hypothetical protein n=1 Tax=Bradyrhizobium sp. 139 TaxID=2782616 RepID=UPI001FF74689|nr:hypothetical protein [Bradyrhizobium sp. 139]MCK1742167.1 hypothetical protein [Bradyrhizobium sp. 139]
MSFGQEIKDFLAGAQTGQKLVSSMGDQAYKRALTDKTIAETPDEEDDKLEKEQKRASITASNQRTALAQRSLALREKGLSLQEKYYDSLLHPPPSDAESAAAGLTAPPRRQAIPAQPAIPTDPDAVPQYAEGGMVEPGSAEDDDDEDDIAAPAIGGDTDISARRRTPLDGAHDAVAAGLKYGTAQLGAAGGVPTPYRQQRLSALMRGAGAAPIEDMSAIYKKIDPDNQMGESERNMTALSTLYQFKLNKGDTTGAQRTAFQMLQHYRMASQRYAAIAAAAAAHGDVDGAAKAAMKAYANIPDGQDLKVWKSQDGQLNYSVTGPDGKVAQQGIATPQQLGAAAMGVATKGFDQFLLDASGQRAATSRGNGGAKGAAGYKPADKDKLLGAIEGAYTQQFKVEGGPGDAEARSIKGNAFRLAQNPRNNITPDEAIDVTARLMSPNKAKPDEPGFSTKKLDDDQGYEVRIGKRPAVYLSTDEFESMAAARAEKLAVLKKTKEAETKKGPGLLAETADAVGGAFTRMRESNQKAIADTKAADEQMAQERKRYGDIRKDAEPDYAIPMTP